MKKSFIAVLALVGVMACNKTEIYQQSDVKAIAFDNAYIDNATRGAIDPSTTIETLDAFNVWAFMNEVGGTVFEGEKVQLVNDAWTYTNTQYWTPENDYYFAALAPMDSENWGLNTAEANTLGAGVVTFTNVDGSEDLIYAATHVHTPSMAELAQGIDPVKFQFNHLLSKVKFTFTNGFRTENVSVKVANVTMTAAKSGSLALNTADWWIGDKWATEGTETYAFGNVDMLAMGVSKEAHDERLIIPAGKDYKYQVKFDIVVYMGTVDALHLEKTATVTGVALEMGKAYNFAAEINPENLYLPSIEFDVVEVKDWITAETPSVQVQESELKAAAILGGSYTLADDVVLTSPVVVPAGSHFVLNLNNKTLKNQVENAATDVIIVEEGAELVINGEGTVEAVSGNDGYAVIAKGKVTINGGTYKAGADQNGEANAVVYARGNGEVYVNGGLYPNDYNSVYVLNKRDADRATAVIEVRGGTFKNFDPADNAAENPGTNFCAEGYTSYADGEYYIVVNGAVVKTTDEFKAAAANTAIEYIIVAADLDFGTEFVQVTTDKVIVGNGHKFNAGGKTTKNYGLGVQKAVNVAINDLVMNGGGGIYVSAGAEVEVNNVTLKIKYQPGASGRHMFYVNNAVLTVNSGEYEVLNTGYKYFSLQNNAKVYVTGGTFADLMAKGQEAVYTDTGASLEISGGKFQVNVPNYKFDPTPYLAAGYKAERVGNYMEVSAE